MAMTTPASVSSQEFLWLLTLLRTQTKQQDVGFCRMLTPAEWEGIIQLAYKLQVGALLYHRVLALTLQETIPLALLQKLQALHRQVAVQNLRNYAELTLIAKRFADLGVPIILLKGAHLAHFVYDSMALRPMSDVDILVQEKDLTTISEQLQQFGFQLLSTNFRHQHWEKPGALHIEVHWTLTRPDYYFHIDIGDWWLRAVPAVLRQTPVLTFCPEDLLLHLCMHAAYHHLFELSFRFVCDITWVIEHFQTEFDWAAFVERTNKLGLQRGIYMTLLLAQEWLHAPIPPAVLAALASYAPSPYLFDQIKSLLVYPEQLVHAKELSINMSEAIYSGSHWQRTKILLNRLFPSPKELALIHGIPYSPWRIYFYYPMRLKYLWAHYAPVAWRLWQGEAPLRNIAQFQNALLNWFQQADTRQLSPPSSPPG